MVSRHPPERQHACLVFWPSIVTEMTNTAVAFPALVCGLLVITKIGFW